jgi:competence protein ComEC
MRSTIWVIGATAAGNWNREFKSSYVICISFMLMIIFNPVFIYDPGFWLSFTATAGIIFVYPFLRNCLKAVKLPTRAIENHVTSIILITASIQLICGPLLIYYFSSLPLVALISNPIISPFFYILLLLLLTGAFTSIIWPPAGGLILKLTPVFFRSLYGIACFFSHPGFPSINLQDLSSLHLTIYYCIVFTLFLIIRIILGKRFDF